MEFNLEAAEDKYAAIAAVAGIEDKTKNGAALGLIKKVKRLSQDLSIPAFEELNIPEHDFTGIAQKSFDNNSNRSNPREATVADYLSILRRARQAQL